MLGGITLVNGLRLGGSTPSTSLSQNPARGRSLAVELVVLVAQRKQEHDAVISRWLLSAAGTHLVTFVKPVVSLRDRA
jgi:hypothetical protein